MLYVSTLRYNSREGKINKKVVEVLIRSGINFLSILVDFGSNLGGPRVVLELTFGGLFWLLGASWGQAGPGWAQDSSKMLFGSDFGRFWLPIRWILDSKLLDFRVQLGRFGYQFSDVMIQGAWPFAEGP